MFTAFQLLQSGGSFIRFLFIVKLSSKIKQTNKKVQGAEDMFSKNNNLRAYLTLFEKT